MQPKRLGYLILAFALALGAWTGGAHGQGQTSGSIRGQVTSAAGAAVSGARVTAVNTETGLQRAAVTDESGRYAVLLLPPGTYRVEAQAIGFAPFVAQEVNVRLGEATPVNPRLAEQAVAIEGITVSGERARIDPTQGGVRQTITPEQVENIPLQGRDFTDLINLSPLVSPQPGTGTGGQFSIGGARTSGTNVQVDGVDANNQFFGENRGSSRTPFAFSLESIKELQLITNGFDVEYGNYVGGVVNAVTKGGTNDLKGGGFLFFRDEALTGDDFRGAPPEDFRVYQFGGNVSGPIVRDRAHFFLSADVQRKDQPIFPASEFDASEVAAVTSILSAQGLQNPEQFFRNTEQAEDNIVLFGRADWSINDNHRLTVRQNFSDFEQTNDRVGREEALTHGGPFRNQAWSTVAELNSVFGANAVNTFRFQYSDEDRPRDPNQPGGYLPELEVEVNTDNDELEFGGDGIIFRNRLEEAKWQLVNNFTYQAGDHRFKIGTNNTLTDVANTFWLLGNGEFEFNNIRNRQREIVRTGLENFAAGTPTRFTRFVRPCPVPLVENSAGERVICPEPDVPFAQFSALEWNVYAQDEWQATDRLLLIAGVRYGGTSFGDDPGELPAVEQAFGVETGVVPDFTGISPRLAFTYDMGGEASGLLRGGVGLLVGRTPLVLAGNVFQTERPLVFLDCRGDAVPDYNLQELLASPTGLNNPFACAGTGTLGDPEHAVFSPDFENARTLKSNLGYERLLGERTKVGVDVIYSRTWDNFFVQDLNIRDEVFTLASENNRPVFIPESRVNFGNFTFGARDERKVNENFDRIYQNVSEGEAEAINVALELDRNVTERLQFGVRYAFSRAYDNGSFSCCTSSEGFNEPTAGDPNFAGDIGDEETGLWGPSDFERRHTVVGNLVFQGPWGIQASGIWRSQSGTPWTPTVRGDLNGDGLNYNDRAFISPELRFISAEDEARFQQFLNENECLAEQVGQIARRNSCRNPWFHSVDLRLAKEVRTFGGQRAEILLDVFNLLNGLNDDWGTFQGVFGSETNLLDIEGFDRNTREYIYAVNEDFGEAEPIGFDPFQFQMQLGVRYRF